jgi:hypothetical protein
MVILLPEDWGYTSVGNLKELVQGVAGAGPADETDWVEWKSTLNLSDKGDCFAIARTILGMANRDPNSLRRSGHGYILVGVEPGNVTGIEEEDPSALEPRISTYTGGSNGPIWKAEYVSFEGVDVLVVVVEPPKMGDPIRLLHRESPPLGRGRTVQAGTVFHRSQGATRQADPAAMAMLQNRLTGGNRIPDQVQVTFEGGVPWLDLEATITAVEAWVQARKKTQLAARSEFVRVRRSSERTDVPLYGQAVSEAMDDLASSLTAANRDSRSLPEYQAEVDAWAGELSDWAFDAICLHCAGLHGQTIRLENQGEKYLPEIEFELQLGDTLGSGWVSTPHVDKPPPPPKPFGSIRLPLEATVWTPPLDLTTAVGPWVEIDPLKITDAGIDLPATRSSEIGPVHLLLLEEPSEQAASWSATCRGMDGILRGSVPIEYLKVSIDVAGVLDSLVSL